MEINLYNEIAKNANMGIEAIDGIKTCVEDDKLKETVLSQRAKLCDIKDRAVNECHQDCKDAKPNMMQSAMVRSATKMKACFDKSNTNIAEMLIEGYNMGLNDLISQSHKVANEDTPRLVGEMIEIYDYNIKELRQFV